MMEKQKTIDEIKAFKRYSNYIQKIKKKKNFNQFKHNLSYLIELKIVLYLRFGLLFK